MKWWFEKKPPLDFNLDVRRKTVFCKISNCHNVKSLIASINMQAF